MTGPVFGEGENQWIDRHDSRPLLLAAAQSNYLWRRFTASAANFDVRAWPGL